MNTAFATGTRSLRKGFYSWRDFCNATPDLGVAQLVAQQTPQPTEAEQRAYAAPLPDSTFKAGVRSFPNLVCDSPGAPGAGTQMTHKNLLPKFWLQ
jgi:hypothetical protein